MARRGFTLLEVVVALIVFALTFGAFSAIFSTGFRQSRAAERAILATLAGQSLMARIGNETRIEPGRFGDELDNGLRFEAVIEPVSKPDKELGLVLFRIELVVFDMDGPVERGFAMSSLRLRTLERD